MKRLLQNYVEQGLNSHPDRPNQVRSAASLPRLEGALALQCDQLSNAALFDLLDT